jgi:hypothetical protein
VLILSVTVAILTCWHLKASKKSAFSGAKSNPLEFSNQKKSTTLFSGSIWYLIEIFPGIFYRERAHSRGLAMKPRLMP